MRESSIVVRPEPMGSAASAPSTRLQAAGLRSAISRFEQVADAVRLPRPPRPVVIADYGAATGYNSLLPIGAAAKAIRRRTRADHSLMVVHTDLPGNDFTALFTTLNEDPASYLRSDSAAFASAIGRSFYQQLLPSRSVTLGWASWANMWLRNDPAELPQIADHVQISYSDDEDARAVYTRQAAMDWHDFVAYRGRELVPGGKLLVLTTAADDVGRFGFRPLLDAIADALDEQARDGLLAPDEVRRMTIPVYGRSERELRAPFAPGGRFEGLSIEHLEIFDAEDRFWERFAQDGNASALGAQWAEFARASVFPILVAALRGGLGDSTATEFVHRLEVAVAARLASAPERMHNPLAMVVLTKHTTAS